MERMEVTQNNIARILDVFDRISKICTPKENFVYDVHLSKPEILAMESIFKQEELIMSNLAHNLNIGFGTATKIIDRLIEKQLVIRERNHDDRRIVKVSLTIKGKEFAAAHQKHKKELFEKILNTLSPAEQENFILIMEKIAKMTEKETQSD